MGGTLAIVAEGRTSAPGRFGGVAEDGGPAALTGGEAGGRPVTTPVAPMEGARVETGERRTEADIPVRIRPAFAERRW